METMQSIEVTFKDTIAKADELHTEAQNLITTKNRIGGCMEALLAQGWKDDAANAFRVKLEEFLAKVEKTSDHVEQVSAAIRSAAQTYYDTEKANIEIANQRSYKK